MRYFAETIPFVKHCGGSSNNSISSTEVIAIYAQDNPPNVPSGHSLHEITDGTYFKYRSVIEESVGRSLADIVKNDTFHNIIYEGTLSLYERYLAAKERSDASNTSE